ncbi:MAG: hypothetical protein U0802_18650 [Candidatus Binatia bacterium]
MLVGSGASIQQHGVREAYMPVLAGRRPDGGRRCRRRGHRRWCRCRGWRATMAPCSRARCRRAPRAHALRECVALLESLAAEVPLVLALEDLHWSDPSTVDLLTRLAQRREPARLLVIATYRAAESPSSTIRWAPPCAPCAASEAASSWRRRARQRRRARLPGGALPRRDAAAGLAEILYAHTEGHPLFLRAVIDQHDARLILNTALDGRSDGCRRGPTSALPDARDMVALQIASPALPIAGCSRAPPSRARLRARQAGDGARSAPPTTWRPTAALARGERFFSARRRRCAALRSPTTSIGRRSTRTSRATAPATAPARRRGARGSVSRRARGGTRARPSAPLRAGRDLDRAIHYLGWPPAAPTSARQRARRASTCSNALALLARQPRDGARDQRELRLLTALPRRCSEPTGPASDVLRETCERALALCEADDDPRLRFQILYALAHVAMMCWRQRTVGDHGRGAREPGATARRPRAPLPRRQRPLLLRDGDGPLRRSLPLRRCGLRGGGGAGGRPPSGPIR